MKRIKNIAGNPFFAGSLIMLVGINIFNVGQFVYHLLIARMLGKAYYGDLAAILSIINEIGIIHAAIGMTVVRFIASGKKDSEIGNYVRWFSWWSIWIGAGTAILAFIASPFIINFLNITQPGAVYLLGPALFISVLVVVGRSILQGLIKFDKYVLSMIGELIVRVLLTLVFVALGYAVFGAMVAIVSGSIFTYLVIRFSLRDFFQGERLKKPEITPLLKYTVPVFVQGLALTSMFTVDVLMVKHFFSPDKAGLYAAMAILGRAVFYVAGPIINVMFPMVSKRYSKGEEYYSIFFISATLIGLVSIFVFAVYWLFPDLAIVALYGKGYLEGVELLWWISIFMSLVAFASLFIQFYLSIGKTRVVWLFVPASLLQAVLIWFIHPDLLTVVKLSILSSGLLVAALLIYFLYHKRP